MPTYEVENTNDTNLNGDFQLVDKPQIVPCGTAKMPLENKRNRRAIIDWSTHSLKEKNETENLAMTRPDNKNAYNMVPQSWMIDYLKMSKISVKVVKSIENTKENWGVGLAAGWKNLAEVIIPRGIFQGDALSPLVFVRVTMPLCHILMVSCNWHLYPFLPNFCKVSYSSTPDVNVEKTKS